MVNSLETNKDGSWKKLSHTIGAGVQIYDFRVQIFNSNVSQILVDKDLNENVPSEEPFDNHMKEEENKKKIREESFHYSRIQNKNKDFHLEKNKKNLVKEIEYKTIDPFFFEIAKNFDKGGYKGLLIKNVKKDENDFCILYNQKESPDEEISKKFSGNIPFKEILKLTSALVEQNSDKIISNKLSGFKSKLAMHNFQTDIAKDFNIEINTSSIQIHDSLIDDNYNLNKELIEEINDTQIRLSEKSFNDQLELDYCESEGNNRIVETPFNNQKMDSEILRNNVYYDVNENINKFQGRFSVENEDNFEKLLFNENFNIWHFLESDKSNCRCLIR